MDRFFLKSARLFFKRRCMSVRTVAQFFFREALCEIKTYPKRVIFELPKVDGLTNYRIVATPNGVVVVAIRQDVSSCATTTSSYSSPSGK